MEHISENLSKYAYFTTLDLAQGCHRIPVDRNSTEKTAFTVKNCVLNRLECHLDNTMPSNFPKDDRHNSN